jgi:hypothetical protein
MKPFLLTLLATLCLLAATAEAQTVKAVSFNTTNNTVVSTNRVIFPLLGVAGGTAGTPALTYTFGTNSFGTFASTQIGVGPFLGFSVEGARRLFVSTNTLRVEVAVSFSDTNVAATTRTNLGLGATNNVTFASVNIASLSANGSIAVTDGTNNFFAAGEDLVEFLVPIQIENSTGLAFSGTNAATAAATTRTNLGLGGGVITNIDVLVSGGGTNTLQFSNGILTNVTTP